VLPQLPDDPEANLFEAGAIDSLSLMEATSAIERVFAVTFEPDDLRADNFRSLKRITKTVERLVAGRS
jgi:acyl carrier protein